MLTRFVDQLKAAKIEEVDRALAVALELDLMLLPHRDWLQ